MIDFRFDTFLALCKTMNFTKAAQLLSITQPAVSQHIKFLESKYNTNLFTYKSKKLLLTLEGEALKNFIISMKANNHKFESNLKAMKKHERNLKFGATLTIGEYLMPNVLKKYLKENPKINFSMIIDNTHSLLNKLNNSEIDFAFIEGIFPKNRYEYKLLSHEEFIPVCSSNSHFSSGKYTFNDILKSRIILREKGSGTRNILENILHDYSLSIESFPSIVEVNSFSTIKQLVGDDIGISFLYKRVITNDLNISKINICDLNTIREFNFVYLKDSVFENDFLDFYSYYCNIIKNK